MTKILVHFREKHHYMYLDKCDCGYIIMIIIFKLLNFIIVVSRKVCEFCRYILVYSSLLYLILNLMLIFKQALHVILYSEYVSFI